MSLCNPYQQWLDKNGKPLAGGRLYAYLAGTTTPTTTWQDANFSILNTNPVILDSAGYSMIWLNPVTFYKFRMTDRWGVQQWTVDNVSGNLLCAPSGGGPVEPGGPPTIIAISPNSGPVGGGNQVTITGTNFDITATVMFNGTPATNVGVLSISTLMATVPAGNAGTVSVTVTVNAQPATLVNAYTYVGLPTVTSISPVSGSTVGGTVVTIIGTNFSAGATVTFGGIPATAVTVNSPTSISATTPPGSGAVSVVVTIAGQSASAPMGYTYVVPVPTVTSVSPNSGPANTATAVTITGTNFAAPATVTFGGVAATSIVVVNSTTITCTTPSHAAGVVAAAVTVAGQTGTLANAYTYVQPAQPIYGTVGAQVPTGTAGVNVVGGIVYLNTGEAFSQLQNTPETVGQTVGPFNPNNQCIYLLLYGASHTFLDQNNAPFVMDPAITVTVSGATMYLYASTNALYFTWTLKIQS